MRYHYDSSARDTNILLHSTIPHVQINTFLPPSLGNNWLGRLMTIKLCISVDNHVSETPSLATSVVLLSRSCLRSHCWWITREIRFNLLCGQQENDMIIWCNFIIARKWTLHGWPEHTAGNLIPILIVQCCWCDLHFQFHIDVYLLMRSVFSVFLLQKHYFLCWLNPYRCGYFHV